MSIHETIRTFMRQNFFVDGFGDDDSFLKTGLVDSMGMLQLVTFLEETFGIRPADDELVPENLDSVARVAAFVERKQSRTLSA